MANFYTKEKITISTLDEMVNRRGFEASVFPRTSLFRYVLAAYSFPRKIASCSVNDCYQNHKKGYLIRYSDNQECSICESCANRFLDPAALKPPKATRTRSTTGSSTRTRSSTAQAATVDIDLATFITESNKIKQQVKELKQLPRGANWLFQSLSNMQKSYPAELLAALKELRAGKEENSVFEALIDSNASDQQLQDVEQLEGLEVFDADIRTLLIDGVLKPLISLDEKAKKAESGGTLRIPVDWSAQVDHNLRVAEQLVAHAQLFFTEQNFERLKSIPLSDKAAKTVGNQCWDCDKGQLKSS